MKLRKGDFVWIAVLALIAFAIASPWWRRPFLVATEKFPYLMGFAKFAILATMGEPIHESNVRTGVYGGP